MGAKQGGSPYAHSGPAGKRGKSLRGAGKNPVFPLGGPRLVAPGANPTNPNFQARPSAAPRTPSQVRNLTKSTTRSALVLSEKGSEDSFLLILPDHHLGSIPKCELLPATGSRRNRHHPDRARCRWQMPPRHPTTRLFDFRASDRSYGAPIGRHRRQGGAVKARHLGPTE